LQVDPATCAASRHVIDLSFLLSDSANLFLLGTRGKKNLLAMCPSGRKCQPQTSPAGKRKLDPKFLLPQDIATTVPQKHKIWGQEGIRCETWVSSPELFPQL
jgi:hypothetical protein